MTTTGKAVRCIKVDAMDRDDWTTSELNAAEVFAIDLSRLILQQAIGRAIAPALLGPDKRAVVEVTSLLEIAASIALRDLRLSPSDFATYASEVFVSSLSGGSKGTSNRVP